MEDIHVRLALIEARYADHDRRLADHERRHDEFMLRTDTRLDTLVMQSNEWAGVRKTLGGIAAILAFIGGIVGFLIHYFWPHLDKS